MTKAGQNLLEVLKAELNFLEKGGYRNPARAEWRPQFIFEDSPTCLNCRDWQRQQPCSACPLMVLVPAEHRNAAVPCRHICLDKQGETIDSLYRKATQEELETAVAKWLRTMIQRLEAEQTLDGRGGQ